MKCGGVNIAEIRPWNFITAINQATAELLDRRVLVQETRLGIYITKTDSE